MRLNAFVVAIAAIMLALFFTAEAAVQKPLPAFKCARLKYSGGGDWYNDPSAVPNLMDYIRRTTGIAAPAKEETVEAGSPNIFQYPFVFMTGHGNVKFSEAELDNLRKYLQAGGFIYVDDDYGMDKSFRREVARLFTGMNLVELPYTHPIYTQFYKFPQGLPKVHEHDGKPPSGYGLYYNERLVMYYTVETNPSDGWANADAHNDPPEKRDEAFRIGTNIVLYAITH
ncbi:MAG: DUF4159 domain-containing protein [Rhizobacter sp.]|nr:DUF4159 domain-containing protein [Chlorobiales bacterium]